MRHLWVRERTSIVSPKAINFFNGPKRSRASFSSILNKILVGECLVILSLKSFIIIIIIIIIFIIIIIIIIIIINHL